MEPEEELYDLAELFKVFGDSTRIRILYSLFEKEMAVCDIANDLGLNEGIDFFLIKDNCLTELEPEEVDENGVGRTLTCIGFKPLEDDMAHQISKKFQLYK